MNSFLKWLAIREGLWIADRNAVTWLSGVTSLRKSSWVNTSLAGEAANAVLSPWILAVNEYRQSL